MKDFTYAFENRNEKLEVYEWDNVWWEQTGKTDAPRVLYIGDSISCATRRVATREAQNTLLFDGLGTSKALDNPFFYDTVDLYVKQQQGRQAVLFNNGLHGWHLDDETDYRAYYEKMILFLKSRFEGTPVILLLTTSVADPVREARVTVRNRVVTELAQAHGLSVIDLYSVTQAHPELRTGDGVHLTADGYSLLAKVLVERVKEVL